MVPDHRKYIQWLQKYNLSNTKNNSNNLKKKNNSVVIKNDKVENDKVENKIIASANKEDLQKNITLSNQSIIEINDNEFTSFLPSIFSFVDQNKLEKSIDLDTYHINKKKIKPKVSLGLFTGTHLLYSNLGVWAAGKI